MWSAPADPIARDRVWFPGGVAADAPEDILALVHSRPDLTVYAQACRFLVIGSTRVGEDAGAAQARRLVADLARRYGDGRAEVLLVAADLLRLGGLVDEAAPLLSGAHTLFHDAGDRVGVENCQLVIGDCALTPWSSPELCGFDPWDLGRTPHTVDRSVVHVVRQAYDEADRAFHDAGSVEGLGAVAVRRIHLAATTGGDAVAAARHACSVAVGPSALLAHTHLLVALVDAGRAGEFRVRFPGEVTGRSPGDGGSHSYVRGLIKILRGAARDRLRRGHPERARLLATAAVETARALGDAAEHSEALEDLAELYAVLRSRGPAIATLRRTVDDIAGSATPEGRARTAAVVLALSLEYQNDQDADGMAWCRERARELVAQSGDDTVAGADAGHSSKDLFTSARERFEALPEAGRGRVRPDGSVAGPEFGGRMLDAVAMSLRESIAMAGVLIPLARGLRERREGLDALASASFRAALAAADALGPSGTSLRVMVLVADRRRAEAATSIHALPDDFPPDVRRDLLAAARDHAAARAVAVMEADQEGPAHARWRAPITAAEIALRTGDPSTARRLAEAARRSYEDWFAVLERDPFRLAATDDVNARWLYLTAAEAALHDGDTTRALQLGDRLRSLPMLRLLDGTTPSDDRLEWQRAAAQWSVAYDLLAASGSSAGIPADDPAAALLGRDGGASLLDRAQVALESAESRIARDPVPLPGLPEIDAVRACLPPDSVLVQYLLAADRLVVGVLTPDVVDGAVLEVDADLLAGHVRRLHAACRRESWPGDAGQARHELARVLLDPIAGHLRAYDRVVVVPSGPLSLLPFGVLPFGDGLLADRHVLSFLPSVAVLPNLPASRGGTTVVVGDPAFGDLPRLPGTLAEARAVARHHGVDAVTGVAATRATLVERLPGARIVHLASHGLVSATAPAASSIALSGTDRLSVADLAGMRFRADLVVLSACDTGRGDVTLGGDVVGLGRQLLAAGAAAAIVSLWPVDDRVACVLMDELHARLAAGDDPAVALAHAQAAVRDRTAGGRAARYEEIAAAAGADPAAEETRTRSARAPGSPSHSRGLLRDARDWAAFVLLGRP